MIKATIIFGGDATRYYNETSQLPSSEWLMDNGFQGKEGQKVPEMTPEIVENISNRYIELYEHITGDKFNKEQHDDIEKRIEANVNAYLEKA